ncbi:TolC family protein [Candidatus Nitrotoga sp. M5]|uniref:TolC family protein n=1 Tax=Candidatus Nitrotoga sp. M5 TaxID=2890409 RepID=UPI001EF59894|nr:TolC family protein [Candidatus Nitrotoga sp. M5]CAH1387290.1 Outer membrane efflux protein [Candidatus Nitrotoga sp. M5]
MKKIVILKFALLFSWLMVGNASASTEPLTLDEVQSSAQQAFPSLLAAKQRQRVAEGEYMTAEGAFDTVLKVQNRWSAAGLYQNRNNDVSIEQPTSLGGTTFFGGWRRGTGDYPVYDGKNLTATDGEARLGVNIPLWRNREIDQRRASLKQAELGQIIAGHEYDQILLEIRRLAAHRYWDWVLAGQRLQIAERLLHIAEQRDAGIRKRVTAGDIPEFEALDNRRAIIERRERRVMAQRMLEQSAIQLSLYWRDAEDQPRMPTAEQLPSGFPGREPAVTLDYPKALQIAQAQRPELRRLEMQSRQTETNLELQQNQRAPEIDLSVMGAKDIGNGKGSLNRNELYVGLNFNMPLQRRVASGRAQVAGANLQRLNLERVLQKDRIAAEVKDILSALFAARKRWTLTLLQQSAAQKLESGERTRFELGDSTLLFVNLREIANGDAALQASEAASNLFKGYADYQAALGMTE